jgi:putative DNA primase/helicase
MLPRDADIKGAVDWGWRHFDSSADAGVLRPQDELLRHLATWVAERMDATIKGVAPEGPGPQHPRINSREAEGWYDPQTIYIPSPRITAATGGIFGRSEVGKILRRLEILQRTKEADRATVGYVPGVGHVQCYAISRERLGLTRQDRPWPARGGRR